MRLAGLVAVLALAGCAHQTPHRTGPVIPMSWPQIYEQCLHQPTFPGCNGR